MNSAKVLATAAVVISAIQLVLSFDCSSLTGKVICECTSTSVECSGIETNVSELEEFLKLANISRMETVVLKIDNLKFAPDFAFENTSIRNLTLGYGLQTLSSNLFSKSSSIVSLDLQNNSIRDIDDQLFSSLSALEKLFLDGNDLHDLKSSMFEKLAKLSYLSMTRNNFREIDSDVFQNLSTLKTLILSHNNVSSIGNLRMISKSLSELKAAHCSIKGTLEKDSLSGVPNLERLDLSSNELADVNSHALSTLKDLKILDVSYNSIERLENYAFYEMKNLISLNLRGNRISVLNETCFTNLKNLVLLDLSGNRISAILCHHTTDFESLEKIYLQDNKIKTFTQGVFFYSPNLKILNVTGNNLECSCPLSKFALYLIENSTIKEEDLESIYCIIPSTPPTISSITDYKISTCTSLELCKIPSYTNSKFPDDEYSYDYLDGTKAIIFSNNDTAVIPLSTESTTESITSSTASDNPSNITSAVRVTIVRNAENTTQATVNASNIPSTEPVTTESTTKNTSLSNTNAIIIKMTSTITTTKESITKRSVPSTLNITVGRTVRNVDAEVNCSSLDLSIPNFSSGSNLMLFKNFSYDGSTFCLKWTIVGDITSVRRCVIAFTDETGTKIKGITCPLRTNEIKTWSSNEKILRFCLDIYVPRKMSFCNNTLFGTRTAMTTEIINPNLTLGQSMKTFGLTDSYSTIVSSESYNPTTTSEKVTTIDVSTAEPSSLLNERTLTEITAFQTDRVKTTSESVGNPSPFSIIALNVHFNHSGLAFVSWVVNIEVPSKACNMTLNISTTSQPFDYEEGVFPCKNNSYKLRNVKESDIVKVCIVSYHETYGKLEECTPSGSPTESKNLFKFVLIPIISITILLLIIAAFVFFKNKRESNVFAEEVEHHQRVNLSPHSTNGQSLRLLPLERENDDYK